jgi:hypothetical protein
MKLSVQAWTQTEIGEWLTPEAFFRKKIFQESSTIRVILIVMNGDVTPYHAVPMDQTIST